MKLNYSDSESKKTTSAVADRWPGDGAGSEKLLTAKQLGELLGVSPKTILSWSELGKIPHYKFGRGRKAPVRFDLAEVREWMRIWYNSGSAEIVAKPRKGAD